MFLNNSTDLPIYFLGLESVVAGISRHYRGCCFVRKLSGFLPQVTDSEARFILILSKFRDNDAGRWTRQTSTRV